MADQKETPKILDEIAQKTTSGSKPRPRTSRSSGNGIVFVLLLLVPLLAAVAFLAYQQNQSSQVFSGLKTESQLLQQQLETQRAEFNALESELSAQLAAISATPVTIDESRV